MASKNIIDQALAALRKARPEQMKRAREAGFDTNKMFLHGTQTSPTEVRPNFYVSRQPEVADVYARRGEHLLQHGEIPEGAAVMPVFVKKGEARTTNPMAGYSVVEDPTSVRSIWAEFDPANKNSANIMGSMAGAAALGVGATAMPEDVPHFAHGGEVDAALHMLRQHKADGGKSAYLFQDPMGYLAKKGEQIAALPGNIADMASAAWEHPLTQAMRVAPGETSKAVGEFALEKGKQGVEYARENPFGATRKVVDFATDWSADPRVILAKQLFLSTPANAGEDEFARQVQYGIRPAPEAEPPQYADGGIVRDEYEGGGGVVLKALAALRGAQKVFPKPQRMFPEGAQPPGGEYLNAATGEAITGQKPARAVIGVTPEGKPVFLADAEQVDVTGSPGPGSTKTKTNLFKQKAGWKWTEAPEGYENVPTIVSAENRGQHYYGLGADFPKGVDLERYADAPSEPRLRPTTQGNVYPGEQVGSISVRGREHPVYDMLTIRNLLAGTGAGAAGAAAMQEAEPSQYARGGSIAGGALMLLSKKAKSRPGRR